MNNFVNTILNQSLIDYIGYLSTVCLITAYGLSQKSKPVKRYVLHLLNLAGCVGIGCNAYSHDALPGVLVNAIWFVITMYAWIKEVKQS